MPYTHNLDKVAQLLLEAGANVNQANTHKHTPLHLSAQNGHLGLSKLLVDAGADVNFADLIGEYFRWKESGLVVTDCRYL